MSLKVKELIISKHENGKHNQTKEVIFSKFVKVDDFYKNSEFIEKSINRLINIYKNSLEDKFSIHNVGILISKCTLNSKFNDMGENILQKEFKSLEHKEKLIKATNRFIKYLNNKNIDENVEYRFSINSQRVGKYYLSFSTRNADVKNLKERRITLQNKLRSYKAQVTRTKNKIDVIINNYNGTLFSEEYKTDKKYIKLLDKLQDKTLNYKNMKSNLKYHDIEITSLFEPSSFNSLKKILKKDDLFKEFGEDIQTIMNEIKTQQINKRALLIEHFGRA